MKVFSIDFEFSTKRHAVLAFSAIVVDYPSGRILDSITRHIRRTDFDADTWRFWKKHADAYAIHETRAEPEGKQTRELANFCAKYADEELTLIGDNPSVDYPVLNGILRSHGLPDIQHFGETYSIPTCTTTLYRAGIRGGPSKNRPVEIPPTDTVPHCPDYDVRRTVGQYFRVLDISAD